MKTQKNTALEVLILLYLHDTPIFCKFVLVVVLDYFIENELLAVLPIILSLELIIQALTKLANQSSKLSYELRKFVKIWISDDFFYSFDKNEKQLRNTLEATFVKNILTNDYNRREAAQEEKANVSLLFNYEIKELYKTRSGLWKLNGEVVSFKQIQARLNGCKGKLRPNIINEELNKKIEFYTKVIKEIEDLEDINKEVLISESKDLSLVV